MNAAIGRPPARYVELRKLLAINFMTIDEYARRIERSTDYVSARLCGRREWGLEDVYRTLRLFGMEYVDIPILFPPNGIQARRRGHRPNAEKLASTRTQTEVLT